MTDNLPTYTVIGSDDEGHFIKGPDGEWYEIFTLAFDEEQLEKCYKFMPGLDPKPREEGFLAGKKVVSVPISGADPEELPDAERMSQLLEVTDDKFGSRTDREKGDYDRQGREILGEDDD